ncbi:teichoic acid D-Ala incorporation-associated protein DltX [Companilactobacillus allii]|uniref:Cytochrome C554 n=1 Tax=Companilactobacillus allii TaxID=1847728 RepID=A0A1P8Q0D8_9LACO|nr:teichoic acid D-Ala incorporation-associated protein DltX [Companilactobacillus allii]APX71291.1 cytochrome C554 [Companilactobacillus allii]USQ68373.1 teichoic acid D-Ala incorporation-associated protein DltX [Companilactobacillus allii]
MKKNLLIFLKKPVPIFIIKAVAYFIILLIILYIYGYDGVGSVKFIYNDF